MPEGPVMPKEPVLAEVNEQSLVQPRTFDDLNRRMAELEWKFETVAEAFLGLFNYKGKHRKQFVNSFTPPPWVRVWMDKQELQKEVVLRLNERPDNTIHSTDAREALRAIAETWEADDDNMQEDSSPKDENYFAQIFNEDRGRKQKCEEFLEAEEFDIIARRPVKGGFKGGVRKLKDKGLEKLHNFVHGNRSSSHVEKCHTTHTCLFCFARSLIDAIVSFWDKPSSLKAHLLSSEHKNALDAMGVYDRVQNCSAKELDWFFQLVEKRISTSGMGGERAIPNNDGSGASGHGSGSELEGNHEESFVKMLSSTDSYMQNFLE
ncbi:hypothetical protein BDD12DRAFT_913074 [Trichophaea hybrida]|nr:hypothetical protein BDD12DRAFT_913074 [Trichophaea hybrida]